MRKRIGMMIVCLLSLTGCSFEVQADYMMKCDYYNKDAEGEKTFIALFTYVSETGETITGKIDQSYKGFEKNEVDNYVLTDMAIRNSALDGIDGIEIKVLREDTSFEGHEEWTYRDVDIDSIIHVDEIQKEMIDTNERFYSKSMIQKYFQENGYTCSMSEIS